MSSLKTLRKQYNLTQQQLADSLGVKRSTVAMWEIGKNLPTTSKLSKLAQIFNITVDDVLNSLKAN